MRAERGETDVALMQHVVEARYPGGELERVTSQLLVRGREGGHSAMARTVGFTAAAAAALLLREPAMAGRGVVRPLSREWYEPMLRALEEDGIRFHESVERA